MPNNKNIKNNKTVGVIINRPKNKGITLISLVITIIILIILAGVAINLTLGDNGIFNRAKYAKEQYQMSQVKEKIELAIADIETDKISNNEECTIDTIVSELPNKIPGLTIEKDGDGAKGTLDDYEYSIDKDFNVTIEGQDTTGGEGNQGGDEIPQVTAENYGQYVDYGIDLNEDGDTTNDWKIFYKEEDETSPNYGNTYIIAANYLDLTKRNHLEVIKNAGMVVGNNTTYNAKWITVPAYDTKMDTDTNVRKRYMFSWKLNTTNPNIKCVSKLLNIDIWDSFVTDKLQEKGGTAIGGPTAEMWVASWNKAYPTSTKLTLNANDTNGYQINGNYYINLDNTPGYTDAPNVYFPHKTPNKALTYWLTSPSSYSTNNLMDVGYFGNVNSGSYSYSDLGLRPLVSLPSVVSLTPSGTPNIWNINYN